uniref:Uncharacterized protein n=1 Tax=Avena sativa TaxID=4498 RepID=A0ACD5YHN6_AVESA
MVSWRTFYIIQVQSRRLYPYHSWKTSQMVSPVILKLATGILRNGMVAVKKLSMPYGIHEKQFIKEVSCLMKTKHEHIVRFLGYCSDTQGIMVDYEGSIVMADVRQMLLCFEYLPRGSLDNYIIGASCVLEWRKRYEIIRGICKGLYYLHVKQRIVHLDLKPANILLDDNMVPKIADFGLSRRFGEMQSRAIASNLIGTLGYLAPEAFDGHITFKVDIYSLGVIITEILTGEKRYRDVEEVLDIWGNRLQRSQRDIHLEQVRVCTEIGMECIESNPAKRPDIQHIISRLDETKGDFTELYQFAPNKVPGETISEVFDISSNTLEKSYEDTQLEQLRVYAEIGIECSENNSVIRPVTGCTIEHDETESTGSLIKTSGSSSSGVQADKDSSELHSVAPKLPGKTSNEGYQMEKGRTLMEKYEIGRLISHGSLDTKVYLARVLKDGQFVAIKVTDKDKASKAGIMARIMREISAMRLLKHPNVLKLFEVMATKSKIYFVLEHAKGGELFSKIARGRLNEHVARKYFHQLISAMDYCHSRGVYHRDLKLENLLLDEDGNLKVSNFGLSALDDSRGQDGLLRTTCGTPAYIAPEVLSKRGYDGAKTDIWSCGVVLFVLVAGYLPFQHKNVMGVYRKIYKAEYNCPRWFSVELKDLLRQILDLDPCTRASFSAIKGSAWYRESIAIQEVMRKQETRDKVYKSEATTSESKECSKSEASSLTNLNAFGIISHLTGFDLSNLIEGKYGPREDMFTTRQPAEAIFARLYELAEHLELKIIKESTGVFTLTAAKKRLDGFLEIAVNVFGFAPDVLLVEFIKTSGDAVQYKQLMEDEIRPALKDAVWVWLPQASEQFTQGEPQQK